MNLDEHIKNEELQRVKRAWRQLTPFQRKLIRARVSLAVLPRRVAEALDRHIHRRRTAFAYLYPAHWI